MDLRAARVSVAALLFCAPFVSSCSSDGSTNPGASGGQGASGGENGAGRGGTGSPNGGAGGASGATATAGSGGSQSQAGGGSGGSAGAEPQCEPITTFETGLEPSTVLHVATTGTASGAGTEQDPFNDIEAAVEAAEPGTAIRVHAGEYPGGIFLSDVLGTEQAPIWIGGAPGEERPVIGGASAEALHVSGARYLVLHDLEITGTSANGVNLDDRGDYDDAEALRHVVVRNLRFHAIGTGGNNDCLKISGANDFFVLDSEFVDCSVGGSNIDHVGCHDGLIAGNTFEGGGTGVQAKGGSRSIEIRGNVFRQNGGRAVNMGGATGFEFFRPPLDAAGDNYEARDIRVIANVFDRSAEVAAMPGCVDCLFAHNTVYRPTTRILRILQETTTSGGFTFLPASNGRVMNNVFSYTRAEITNGGRAINVGADTSPATFSYANNLWYASDDVSGSDDVDYQGATVTGTLAAADPGLVAPTSGDFSLSASSPALSGGVVLTEAPQDFAGTCYAAPPAVGAFERQP